MHLQLPLVSCCISTWNRVSDLRSCISSILSQDYRNLEIVIIDNASFDGTETYCEYLKLTSSVPIIYKRMVHSDHSALETINLAFYSASGKYVLILDDDAALISNTAISKSVEYMEEPDNAQVFAVAFHVVNNTEYTILNNKRCVPEFCGAAALFRRDIGNDLHWYDESLKIYGNELDISIRAYIHGYSIVYLHDCLVRHPKSDFFKSPYTRNKFALKNSLHAVINYFGFKKRILMTLMYGAGHIYYISKSNYTFHLFSWWIPWYFKTLLKAVFRINKIQAPAWIQDYYYIRLLNMMNLI